MTWETGLATKSLGVVLQCSLCIDDGLPYLFGNCISGDSGLPVFGGITLCYVQQNQQVDGPNSCTCHMSRFPFRYVGAKFSVFPHKFVYVSHNNIRKGYSQDTQKTKPLPLLPE